ncbi:MAG: GerMN domain-containing protein [Patescibacteria group bacterium]|nr:GerMN domain-containing protein [Patescibacteria group bacterium]
MRRKNKIIILAAVLIVILFGFWEFLARDQGVNFIIEGKRETVHLPRFPGMQLISSQKGECSFEASYAYRFYKGRNLSKYVIDSLKEGFILKSWEMKDARDEEGFNVFEFYKEKDGKLETVELKIGFQENKGTVVFLNYKRPPCSESKKERATNKIILQLYFNNSNFNPNLEDCRKVYPVTREFDKIPENIALQSLTELLKGPSPEEISQGYISFFSEKTKLILKELKIKDETAYVNFYDFRSIIPNVSASCGSAEFMAEIETTLKQFPNIKKVIFAIEGKPAVFYEWVQLGCTEENNNCDGRPFQ